MGCGTSKAAAPASSPAPAQPTARMPVAEPKTAPAPHSALSPAPARAPPLAPAKITSTAPAPAKAKAPAKAPEEPKANRIPQSASTGNARDGGKPKKGGARFNDGNDNTVQAQAVGEPERKLKQIVSFSKDEKSDFAGERKVPDTPFVKKGIGFDEMFDEEGEEEEEVSIKRKKNKGGVAFRADSQAEGGKQKGGAPGTPFVRLGAAFDDLYDDDEQEEDEEQPLPPPKKEKGKKAGIKFADGDGASGEEKEKLTPGTPFVKMGGGFDDLYDEDEDEEKESDEEDEPSPVPKKDKSRKTCFTEDTKDEEGGLRQPGTPFVKLGGFNDLYDEDDEDEEDDNDFLPPPKSNKGVKKGTGGGVMFSEDTEDKNSEARDRVPGTPFVKLGGFNDLYDEDDDEDEDQEEEDEGPRKEEKPPKHVEPSGGVDNVIEGVLQDVSDDQTPGEMMMDLPVMPKVRVA